MEWVNLSQVVTVGAFLGLLLALRWWIGQRRGAISARLRPGRLLEVVEVLPLGPHERLTLVRLGGRQVLVHSGRGGPAQMLPLDPDPAMQRLSSEDAA